MRTLPLLFALALFAGHAFAAGKPNVLFIFADDMAYDTIACQGNTEIQTPNLDRLAARSTAFRHCYNMGGYHGAVCVASRTMLNTGVFVWHAQREEKRLKSHYQPNGLMWAQLMEKAGYDTYMTGKWHVSVDAASVFGTAKHVRGGMPRQTKEGYDRPVKGQEDVWQPWDKSKGGFWEGGKHWSEVVGDDALEFLDTAKGSENPFFMYIAFNAPHDPRQSPKEYVDRYPLEKISLPKPFLPE
ncbi:MAG: sulfatase-like hydrolase/transferase, partial [Verrucomicrobiales bacterium]